MIEDDPSGRVWWRCGRCDDLLTWPTGEDGETGRCGRCGGEGMWKSWCPEGCARVEEAEG